MQLQGKRIIVTGGASGIGAATVLAYARERADVISLDVNDDAGERVAKEASNLGPGLVAYRHCDVSNREEVTAVFTSAVAELGGLDVLTAIAGVEQRKPTEELTDADLDKMFDVNVKGTVWTNQAAGRYMLETGGSIINYSSMAGIAGMLGMPAYSAAKGAVLGFTRSLAKEWGALGIRVNAVSPAAMTEMAEQWFAEMSVEERAAVDTWLQMNIPLGGKLGPPEDVAALNVFLASDGARYITGQTICCDGGFTMAR